MKGLTLWQPWASLIAVGAKTFETRSWTTGYRGPIAIHAAKRFPGDAQDLVYREPFREHLEKYLYGVAGTGPSFYSIMAMKLLPLGAIVAVADLTKVHSTGFIGCRMTALLGRERAQLESAFGDWTDGRFAWEMANVRPLAKPIPCSGAQGLWNVPAAVESEIRRQLEAPHA